MPPSRSNLSRTDAFAAASANLLLLLGRVALGSLFLTAGWGKLVNRSGTIGFFTSLKLPFPEFWAVVCPISEVMFGLTLILGLATRYAAMASFVFVLIATAIAHRYWDYPVAQQTGQFNHFTKNIAIMGGLVLVFVTGAGRFSVDTFLGKR